MCYGKLKNLNRILYSGLKLKQCVSSAFLRENLHFVHVIYLKRIFSSFCSGKCSIPSSPLRLHFDCCSTGLRLGFESASRQIPNRFVTASTGLQLAFGGKRRAPEELRENCRIRYGSVTFLLTDREERDSKIGQNGTEIFVSVKFRVSILALQF